MADGKKDDPAARSRTSPSSCRKCGIRWGFRFRGSACRGAGDRRAGLGPAFAGAAAGLPFPNPAAMFATLDPAELERKIGELRIVEGWLQMSLNMMQLSIKTMELQKASLEALRGAPGAGVRAMRRPPGASPDPRSHFPSPIARSRHAPRPLLRLRLPLRVARAARARAQGAPL